MNPEGLSQEAIVRKQASGSGDLVLPNFSDQAAVGRWRVAQHEAWGEATEVGEAPHHKETIAGVSCLVAGASDAPTVVYLHGGGFCLGSPGTAIPITARLATRLRVISVDYRLGPEQPCPAGIDDVEVVCRELGKDTRFSIAGDSAGANLALATTLFRLAGCLPDRLALFSPHLDFRSASRRGGLAQLAAAYLGSRSPSDPLASPLAATDKALAGLPPTLVQTTDAEPMFPQAQQLAERMVGGGGNCELQIWLDLWHAWHYHRELPEAWEAVDLARDWLAITHRGEGGTLERDGR